MIQSSISSILGRSLLNGRRVSSSSSTRTMAEWGNYGGIKLLDQVMNVLNRVAKNFQWQQVHIDDMQFSSMPGCSTTDTWTCHVVDSSQTRHWGVAVQLIQSMYDNARSRMRVGCNLSEESSVKVHLFITVLEALPRVSHMRKPVCRWPGHHHWIAEGTAREAACREDQHGRNGASGKHGQTKVLISGPGLDELQKSGKGPCGGRQHKLHFLWWMFQLDPQEIQWYPWLSEAWSQLPGVNGVLYRSDQ